VPIPLITTLVSALLPVGLDLVKNVGGAASRKWLGLTIDDEIKLNQAKVETLKALSELENPYGSPSQWVVDLRGSFRYIAATLLVLGGGALAIFGASQGLEGAPILATGIDLASAPFGFIFGERLVLSLRDKSR